MAAYKRLYRSTDRWLAGVCAGVAEHFDCDPLLVRVIYLALSLGSFGFPGLLVYIILWILVPSRS